MEVNLSELGPRYAFCDPHGGKHDASHRRLSSRAAIAVGVGDALGRVFVLHTWAARCSTDELIERIYTINDRWKPKVFGIESNGLQALFGDAIRRDARLRGKKLPLVGIFQPPQQEKDFRIRTTLQPLIGNGRLFLLEGQDAFELKHEIITFPQNPLKDLIDATASMVRLIPPKAAKREVDEELLRKLSYLRSSGADPRYIDDVAKGIRV